MNPQPDAIDGRQRWLFVLPWSPGHPGGVNQVVGNLAREMERSGNMAPALLIIDWDAPVLEVGNWDGRPAWRLRIPDVGDLSHPLGALKLLARAPLIFYRLVRLIRRERITVINVHYPGPSAFFFAVLRGVGLVDRLLLSVHGLDITGMATTTGIRRRGWDFTLARCDGVIACSRALADRVRGAFPTAAREVHVIHNGVDRRAWHADRESGDRERVSGAPFHIVNVATFEEKKGQDVLLHAVADLSRQGCPLKLTLIGREGPAMAGLQRLAAELSIAHLVSFIPNVPHERVGGYLATADLFALPSREEPFGIVLLEAGLFRLPVIASAVGGVPEFIEDDGNGCLVLPDDSRALGKRIRWIVENPREAGAFGNRLYEDVMQRFTWDRILPAYMAVGVRDSLDGTTH